MSEQKRLDRPDRGEMARRLLGFNRMAGTYSKREWDALEEDVKSYWLRKADQILALIPDMEYLAKQLKLADKNYTELKSAVDERVEEAKKQERERIFKEIEELLNPVEERGYIQFDYPRKDLWQALKGGK